MGIQNLKVCFHHFKKYGALLTLVFSTSFSGCRKSDCQFDFLHVHMYTREDGFTKYLDSERLRIGDYSWNESFLTVSSDELKLLQFEEKHHLLRITLNQEPIQTMCQEYQGFSHTEYAFLKIHGKRLQKVWSCDKNYGLLKIGSRHCTYQFKGYRVFQDDYGNFVLEESPYTSNLFDYQDFYPYMMEDDVFVLDDVGEDIRKKKGIVTDKEELKQLKKEYPDAFDSEKVYTKKVLAQNLGNDNIT